MHTMTTEIKSFEAFDDASGAPALVEVRAGRMAALFACDMLGGATCNCVGSGLSVRMTARAADAARRAYSLHVVGKLGAAWVEENRALYAAE